ncbi:hypothetical protein Cha6605_3415 [Chamaesiphon minutus PCC 6605]|uniref:Uncharacterized protein n=1 Tax=Chamaesiphon minutus (strain ATCC 27169 / PCC 6605) TaxID=1173020 RepID=K9UIZ8_CHAP6|nr:hypothetical protein Cha6605_3415 [Chamaesiphon minutus PCC 6605]
MQTSITINTVNIFIEIENLTNINTANISATTNSNAFVMNGV